MSNRIPLAEMATYYTPELKRFLMDLGGIAQTMNIVEMVTPVNAGEEKQRWLELAAHGKWMNPDFRYNRELLGSVAKLHADTVEVGQTMKTAFESISGGEPGKVLYQLAEQRYQEVYLTTMLAKYMLEERQAGARDMVNKIFGAPAASTVAAAHDFARALANGKGKVREDNDNLKRIRRELKDLEFDAEKIRENFVWMAQECGIAETRPVVVDEATTSIDVRDKSLKGAVVSIPADRKVSGLKLVELTGHEILCHWCDSERAIKALPLIGGGALKPADEVLYEGHATLTDFNTHLMLGDAAPRQQLPFYVIAMDLAEQGLNFAELARVMYDVIRPTKLSDETALNQTWTTCYRVLRGSNGQNSYIGQYVFTKDRAYFEGRLVADKLHMEQMDSILELSTLSLGDVELLKTVVDFPKGEDNLAQTKSRLQKLVQRLLDDEVVF